MADTGENIGMMSGAYFVGRVELLRWLNKLTGLNYTKIEQTASGVAACHIFDAMYPGTVRLEKVKFNARQSHDFIHNYKVLQAAFSRAGMKKDIHVEKLVKGKYQDNLEFMQWVKAYFESHATEDARTYDGRARRESIANKQSPRSSYRPLAQNRAANGAPAPVPATKTRPVATNRSTALRSRISSISPKSSKPRVDKELYDKVLAENEDLKRDAEELQSDRDFYFEKLRHVEEIVQAIEEEVQDIPDDIERSNILLNAFDDIKSAMYSEGADGAEGEPLPEEEQPADENVAALQEHLDDADLLADEEGYIDDQQ